jgi:hypothetical protein
LLCGLDANGEYSYLLTSNGILKKNQETNLFEPYSTGEGGGTIIIPETAYANNAEAVAALGTGKLYKSATSIEGSPIILITI